MKTWLQNSFLKIKQALSKTTSSMPWHGDSDNDDSSVEINDEFLEDLFERLIKADLGIELSEKIIDDIKKQIYKQSIEKPELKTKIKETIKNIVGVKSDSELSYDKNKLNVILIVGVNGSGKTTTIGKLANRFKEDGLKVLIIAGDTFRAAAEDQLSIWGQRAGVEVFSSLETKKPDAVVFSGLDKAKQDGFNLVLVDTAGRLHSQTNLMDELKKINSVIEKKLSQDSNIIVEKLIILDATIGQNAIMQAELFSQAIKLTGIVLAKLDSSAKGGVVLNIINKLSLPVKLVGVGEKIDDLLDFNFDEYLEGLLS